MKVRAIILVCMAFPMLIFSATVKNQLMSIGFLKVSQGFRCTQTETGSLDEGERSGIRVYLEAGHYYEIYGACDNDCQDLDMKLYDLNGELASRDISSDDIPIVSCNVYVTAWYILKVKMYDCSEDPCSYGVAVFGR